MSQSSAQFHRLVDRGGLRFEISIDGRPVEVQAGDLAITAILLHQPAVRRFEFGDGVRAGFCLMGACQDCWVKLGDGRRVRACDTAVEPGMRIETGLFHASREHRN
ncbi:(2Fe-2S)-binding protein [Mesorhizobium sp. B2-6-2]|uniref:(2Fe-2S)-binding protein n=1 Tax=Mesorhizobium sp. B2-6-2 TaxID=2589915 RepID=UPI0011289571|nr:(2Fe-2S)-binding protein [Mesorhizobium sp. B2-6-2]TPJ77165.1 (2Fe-2S)-binding protein [Mesorhizobium sp. B2-6-2]